jgi:hypothetical protein
MVSSCVEKFIPSFLVSPFKNGINKNDNLKKNKAYNFHNCCSFVVNCPVKTIKYGYNKFINSRLGAIIQSIILIFKSFVYKNGVNGKITFRGVEEEGTFKYGTLNGYGKRTYLNGEVEEGLFKQGSIVTGKGKLECRFENKKSKYCFGIRQGDFVEGVLNGQGTILHFDGIKEVGFFENNNLTGEGVRTYPDGSEDKGIFVKGEIYTGEGKRDSRKGLLRETGSLDVGTFENGRFVKGKKTYNGIEEEGSFYIGELSGLGKRICRNGDIEEGVFISGKLNGMGIRICKNGDIEDGTFKDGQLSGKGKKTYKNGDVAEGSFYHGTLSGDGDCKITFNNGTVHVGKFAWGKLDGEGKIIDRNGIVREEGKFTKGFLLNGTKIDYNGDRSQGHFSSDTFGILLNGTKTYSTGIVEAGRFHRGSIYGYGGGPEKRGMFESGTRTYPNGEIEEGEFANGVLYKGRQYKGADPETRKWKDIIKENPFKKLKREQENFKSKEYKEYSELDVYK